MCVPGCQETVARRLSRRRFLMGAAALGGAAAATAVRPARATSPPLGGAIRRLVEMTHTMGEDFLTFGGDQNLEIEAMFTLENDGFNMNRWHLVEHTGTHMDAPVHFSTQDTADVIPIEKLVVPLAVVDIRAKTAANDDAQLTPDDLRAWEGQHGRIPRGACVAMYSGWEQHLGTDKFRNADANGVLHFPGFHVEAVQFLLGERDVHGIAVDTMSLDYGPSADFATHYSWLPANRWGMEAVANLGQMPARGGTFIAAGPKIAGATGGMTRCIGLVHA